MADEGVQYEFKSVRAIRGREAETIAKWRQDGWELDTQSQGLLRTEITFRRVKPKTLGAYVSGVFTQGLGAFRRLESRTQRRLLAVSGGLVLLMVAIGVGVGIQGGGGSPQPATAPAEAVAISSEQPSKQASREPEASAPSKPAAEEILTVKNSKDLAAILAEKDDCSSQIEGFATKYRGRTIEFDGNIASMNNHGNYKTRYDILVNAGDYSETSASGPSFQFKDVNIVSDLHLTGSNIPDRIGRGDNLHIIAKVGDYGVANGCLFLLQPVSTTVR